MDMDLFMDPLNIIFSSSSEEECSDEEYDVPQKKRKHLVRPFYMERTRNAAFTSLFNQLRQDLQLFRIYTRMNVEEFEELLSMIGPSITKPIVSKKSLSPRFKLAVTLRYLATGESQGSLAIAYRCSEERIHCIVTETTKCIITVLQDKVFPELSEDYLKTVASGFETKWNFPNCIGAIDGKLVTFRAPQNSESELLNKKMSSIEFMAICDHDYNFIVSHVGHQNDAEVRRESSSGKEKRFYSKILPIPKPRNVTNNFTDVPYVLVANEVFTLTTHILKPYTTITNTNDRTFNYRISRANRMAENCFGVLAARWRVFRTAMAADITLVKDIVQCCVCLHNWLRKKNTNYITPELLNQEVNGTVVPGSWNDHPNNLKPLQPLNVISTNQANLLRQKFADYFSGEGQNTDRVTTKQ